MNYNERLKMYEKEKQELLARGLSPTEYMQEVIKLARKWRV